MAKTSSLIPRLLTPSGAIFSRLLEAGVAAEAGAVAAAAAAGAVVVGAAELVFDFGAVVLTGAFGSYGIPKRAARFLIASCSGVRVAGYAEVRRDTFEGDD